MPRKFINFQAAIKFFLASAIAVLLLPGCVNSNTSDLEAYVHQQRSKAPEKIPPLPQLQTYTTYTYKEEGLRNPFVPQHIGIAKSIDECPEITRVKDPLETVPLDSLMLVGSLEQEGERWALIRDQQSNVYRLRKGSHLGQNNGEIITITESELVLRELVSDRLQGCQTRQTTLAIAAN